MIAGELSDLKNHLDGEALRLILGFTERVKAEDCKIGEWEFLNDEIKALVLCKDGYKPGQFEAHKIYRDLHIVMEGADTIFIGDKQSSKIKQEYDKELDYVLFASQPIASVKLLKNSFALIDQNELHTNEIDGTSSKKIVIKIK